MLEAVFKINDLAFLVELLFRVRTTSHPLQLKDYLNQPDILFCVRTCIKPSRDRFVSELTQGDGRGYRYRTSWWQSRKLFARVWDHYWSVNKTQHKNASQRGLERNSIATGIYIVIAATHIKLTGHCSKVSRAEARIDRTFALDTYHALGAHGIQFPVTESFVILRMFLAGDIDDDSWTLIYWWLVVDDYISSHAPWQDRGTLESSCFMTNVFYARWTFGAQTQLKSERISIRIFGCGAGTCHVVNMTWREAPPFKSCSCLKFARECTVV